MPLLPEHADTFAEKLSEALNLRQEGSEEVWDCEHDYRRTRRILAEMGFSPRRVRELVKEFHDLGGHCDCEVMFNVICTE